MIKVLPRIPYNLLNTGLVRLKYGFTYMPELIFKFHYFLYPAPHCLKIFFYTRVLQLINRSAVVRWKTAMCETQRRLKAIVNIIF